MQAQVDRLVRYNFIPMYFNNKEQFFFLFCTRKCFSIVKIFSVKNFRIL